MTTQKTRQDEHRPSKPSPAGAPASHDQQVTTTMDDVVTALCRLWSETLGGDVTTRDDFFSLGGDSITAIRMLGRANAILGSRVPYRAFRDAPTIEALIATARAVGPGRTPAMPVTILPTAPSARQVPISKQQLAAWFAYLVSPASRAYLAESATTFVGQLDVEHLRSSLLALFARHEVYRTIFHEVDGEPVQTVLSAGVLHLEEFDASDSLPDAQASVVDRAISQRLPLISDLSRLPLCNFLLIRFAEDRHVLVHREHHIIHDGWSSSEFTRELIELYKVRAIAGYVPVLSEPIPYRDYAVSQAAWLQTPEAQKQLDYWRDTLDGGHDSVRLFGKDASSLTYQGDHVRTRFSRAEWQSFEGAAQQLKVTSFVLFTAVMFVCLWRYSGQTRLSLGSAFAARTWQGSDHVLGMLVNTVVLTQRIEPGMPFSALVGRVDGVVQGALENQDYPFVSLVEKLCAERGEERNPFTNVLLGFHDTPIDVTPPPGLEFYKDETVPSDSTKFDLTALVVHRARHSNERQDVNVLWEYRSDVYDRWEIDAFTSSVAQLVRQIASGASPVIAGPLKALDVLTPDQKRLLATWSDGGRRALPLEQGLAAAILQRAAIAPSAVAIMDGSVRLTYAELTLRATELAGHVRAHVREASGSVGISYPRGAANVVAMLAALSAGIPFVMLDAALPSARLDYIVADADVQLVLGPADIFSSGSTAAGLPRVEAFPDDPGDAGDGASLSPRTPSAHTLAYIGYTSGSTGRPKGVEVTHRGLFNVVAWQAEAFGYSERTVATSVTYPGFDAYMSEVWAPLLSGGRLLMGSDEVKRDPTAFAKLLHDERVTSLFLPSGLFREFVASGARWPSTLETVSAGGEALPDLTLPVDFRGRFYNLYGPTETTVFSTMACLRQSLSGAPPIGRPIANNAASVVDADGLLCPPGVPGELLITGEGVALGYRGLPLETEARFQLPTANGGPRTFRTGDGARWRDDGELIFLGRLDDELKVRGYRVAPGEIVSHLENDPGVAQAAVAIKNDALFAYVVKAAAAAGEDQASDGSLSRTLRRALKNQLPAYMLPQAIVFLEMLPLTTQGKLDRNALPSPLDRPVDQGTIAESPMQKALQAIWQDVLGRPVPSVSMNFFAAGGHSLLAMRVISSVRKAWTVELALADFYRNGTIAAQARLVEERCRHAADDVEDGFEEGTI